MSYKVEIVEDTNASSIEIQSAIGDQTPVVEILQSNSSNLILSHDIALLPSDFNYNVQNIINSFLSSGSNISISPSGSFLVIGATGLQPSGDYSLVGHNHYVSDIVDFNSGFSGLLPVQDILAGSGISVNNSDGLYTVAVTGQFGLTSEQVDDRVNQLLVGTSGISVNYDDNNNVLYISTVGLQPSGNYSLIGHSHSSSSITDFASSVSGLLPVKNILGSGYVYVNPLSGSYTISVSGLQPSGSYASSVHSHVINDITGLQLALDNKQPSGNYATLVGGLISSSQLPSYVDDVLEYANSGTFPVTGETGKIYVTLNTNKTYRWSGSSYIEISASPGSSDSVPEGSINKYYTDARASGAAPVQSVAGKTGVVVLKSSDISISSNYIGSPTIYANDPLDTVLVNLDTQIENCLTIDQFHNENSYATSTVPGVIKIGSGVAINSGVISVSTNYASPTHTHGNITNDGKIGSLSGQLVITTTSGLLTVVSGIPSSQITDFTSAVIATAPPTINASLLTTGILPDARLSSNVVLLNTNFGSGVSGLLPVKNITGSGYVNVSNTSGTYNISVSGLQPSGNYSLIGHTHSSNDITNFNSSVSGLLPVTNITGNSGIYVSTSGTNFNISSVGLAYTSGANFNSLSVSGVPVSLSGHVHSYTDITNFASGIQNNLTTTLLPGSFITINYDSILDTLTVSTSGLQPSGNYSTVGHTHAVSDITNFGSGVSGFLPVKNVTGSGYVNVTNSIGTYTVSVTGLQPSGNYSVVGHSHVIPDVSGLQTVLDSKQPSGNYSLVGHTHTSSDITNFNSSVSGLLPVKNIVGSGYANIVNNSGTYTINVTGVQPSGNYANSVHSHGNITNSGTIGSTSGVLLSTSANGLITTIANSLTLGSTNLSIGQTYASLSGLTSIVGNNINNPTVLTNCIIDGGSL